MREGQAVRNHPEALERVLGRREARGQEVAGDQREGRVEQERGRDDDAARGWPSTDFSFHEMKVGEEQPSLHGMIIHRPERTSRQKPAEVGTSPASPSHHEFSRSSFFCLRLPDRFLTVAGAATGARAAAVVVTGAEGGAGDALRPTSERVTERGRRWGVD